MEIYYPKSSYKSKLCFLYCNTIMETCLNCNTPLTATQKFCSECGQKTSVKRVHLHDVFHDMIHYFTHADKGIFTLLKSLIVKPGLVAKEYVEGKRKKHFPPLNFFLIVAAIYVLTDGMAAKYRFTSNTQQAQQYKTEQRISAVPDAKEVIAAQKIGKVSRFFAKYSNYVAMLAAPLISLLIWLVYLKGRYNYTEHLVANLYLIGFTNLFRCLLIIPVTLLLGIHAGSKGVQFGFVGFEIIYRSLFYYRFMGQYNSTGVMKSIALSIGIAAFWWMLIAGIIYAYIALG